MDELLFNFLLKILILFLFPLTVSGSRRELTVEVKILKLNFLQSSNLRKRYWNCVFFAMVKLGQKWTIPASKKFISQKPHPKVGPSTEECFFTRVTKLDGSLVYGRRLTSCVFQYLWICVFQYLCIWIFSTLRWSTTWWWTARVSSASTGRSTSTSGKKSSQK